MTTTRVLGMISGTSHDGIDAAVVGFSLEGDALDGRILHSSSTPYPAALRRRLVEALPPAPTTLAEVCELDTLIGQMLQLSSLRAAEPVLSRDEVELQTLLTEVVEDARLEASATNKRRAWQPINLISPDAR